MDPTMAGMALLSGLMGGKGGNTSSSSQATNAATINFNPQVVANTGAGPFSPSAGSATADVIPTQPTSQTLTNPSQGNPLASLFPSSTLPLNPSMGYPVANPALGGTGVTANLTSQQLLLIGGLGLLVIMSLMGGKGHRRR